jgi:hypothetical protein
MIPLIYRRSCKIQMVKSLHREQVPPHSLASMPQLNNLVNNKYNIVDRVPHVVTVDRLRLRAGARDRAMFNLLRQWGNAAVWQCGSMAMRQYGNNGDLTRLSGAE